MNELTDRPTPVERQGTPDCLVELALNWIQRDLSGKSTEERTEGVHEIALIISQMRHLPNSQMDRERRRWIERVIARIGAQTPEMRGHEQAATVQMDKLVTAAMITYHDWREHVAPPFSERRAA